MSRSAVQGAPPIEMPALGASRSRPPARACAGGAAVGRWSNSGDVVENCLRRGSSHREWCTRGRPASTNSCGMDQRVSLITLGVGRRRRGLERSEALGRRPAPARATRPQPAAGVGLWDRARLAEDSGVEDGRGWGGVTLAYNVPLAGRGRCGDRRGTARGRAELARDGAATFWGGYSGVFVDPDGIRGRSPTTRTGRSPTTAGAVVLAPLVESTRICCETVTDLLTKVRGSSREVVGVRPRPLSGGGRPAAPRIRAHGSLAVGCGARDGDGAESSRDRPPLGHADEAVGRDARGDGARRGRRRAAARGSDRARARGAGGGVPRSGRGRLPADGDDGEPDRAARSSGSAATS